MVWTSARPERSEDGRGSNGMKIFVGNLPHEFRHGDLIDLFKEHGRVLSAWIALDRETGNCRGFGFVDMPDEKQAQNAIEVLNGRRIGNRKLRVNLGKPRPIPPDPKMMAAEGQQAEG